MNKTNSTNNTNSKDIRRENSEKRIIWEQWKNPLEQDENDIDEEDLKKSNNIDSDNDDHEDGMRFQDSYSDDMSFRLITRKVLPCIATPIGFFPITEHNKPSRVFNIWILHTNFSLTKGNLHDLDCIEGIEAIQPITRYRILITFGLMFNEEEVKEKIAQVLGVDHDMSLNMLDGDDEDGIEEIMAQNKEIEILDDDLRKQISELKDKLSKTNVLWSIYILPNGLIKSCASENAEDDHFWAEFDLYRRTFEAVGGLILKSNIITAAEQSQG